MLPLRANAFALVLTSAGETCLVRGTASKASKILTQSAQSRSFSHRATQRENIGDARWPRRTGPHWINFLCETLRLKLLLGGLCVKTLLCDAANPPMIGEEPIRPSSP